MMLIILAFYLVIVGVLVTKYYTWTPKNIGKVALFVLPVPTIIIAMLFTMLAGKVTKTDVKRIVDELQQSSDLIEDILKDEA
ncbi:putative membrane protein [Salmonella phage rutana]|uniref:Putative membrane protein n=1 Tax=Salmonella phage rutana TaxID=2713318 RepID=A0A6G8RL48_9CAUD|nr:putative membrane protein [Salmonella phage rutana]